MTRCTTRSTSRSTAGRRGVHGVLHADCQFVILESSNVAGAAQLAAWLRDLFPDAQRLILWDEDYNVVVPLERGMSAEAIVAAARAQAAAR